MTAADHNSHDGHRLSPGCSPSICRGSPTIPMIITRYFQGGNSHPLVSHPPFQGWSPTILRTVTTISRMITNTHIMVTLHPLDGHPPSPRWSGHTLWSTTEEFDSNAVQHVCGYFHYDKLWIHQGAIENPALLC